MTVPNILLFARETTDTSLSSTDFNDAALLPYLNMVYHDVQNAIINRVDEDYFVSEFYTDTVADQERYERKASTSTTQGFKNIKELFIKWSSSDTYGDVLRERNSYDDDVTNDQTAVISQGEGFYDIRGKYIHVYPTPTSSVSNGLKIIATKTLIDLTATDTEDLIFPDHSELRERHTLLVYGLNYWIYQLKGDINLKNDAKNEYLVELERMIDQMKFKNSGMIFEDDYDLSHYAS